MCKVEGCTNPASRRGWCGTHYRRWIRHGDPNTLLRPWRNDGGPCAVDGCDRDAKVNGWCATHNRYNDKYGSPTHRTGTCRDCGATFTCQITPGVARQLCDSCTAHPERVGLGSQPQTRADRDRSYRRNYGITLEQYEAMLASQGNQCAICGQRPSSSGKGPTGRLHVDHDHDTGQVRALLCNNCNRGIGYLQDNPDLLVAAATYLRHYVKEPAA